MYVIQRKKRIACLILIIFLVFVSCTGVILESNSYASAVVATGMSIKALWVAIAAISAGVVFTSPQGVNDFTEGVLRDLERVTPQTGGFTDAEYDQLLKDVNEKFGNAKKKLPKPPDPNKMKNKLLWIGGSASILADKVLSWLKGESDVPSDLPQAINLGGVVFRGEVTSKGSKIYANNRVLFDTWLNTSSYSGLSIDKIDNVQLSSNHKNVNFDLQYTFIDLKGNASSINVMNRGIPLSEFNMDFQEDILKGQVIAPTKPKPKPKPSIPGVIVPEKLPDKVDPKKAPILPMPVPHMPQLPSTEIYPTPNPFDWSDFGFDVEPVINPNPNPNPNPDPSPQEVQQPTKYPQIGQTELLEMDSGVQPDDLIGVNQQGLDQFLQNNTYNITNNTYTENKLDIDDPDFDNIEFDFSPLSDIGRAFVGKFPFCIPFDLIDSIRLLSGKPVPPKFVLPLNVRDPINRTQYKNNIEIDFERFETLALLSRIFFTILFLVILMFATSKTMKW